MEIEKYKALLCTLELGSLSAAAESLGYTPSGISRMMASLEKESGFPLLIRGRAGVRPTPDCEKLMPTMREMVRLGDHYQEIASEICGLETGSVVVGTSYNFYYQWMAELLADFEKVYPQIRVTILEGTSSQLNQMVEDHTMDFCIISRRDGSHRWIPLKKDRLLAWVPKNHPAVKNKFLPLNQLKTEPFIEIYPGQETDNSRFFREHHIRPNTRHSTTDTFAAYSMVSAGLGIALVNEVFAHMWQGDVEVLPLDPPQYVDIGIAVPTEERTSPAVKRFIQFAEEKIWKEKEF